MALNRDHDRACATNRTPHHGIVDDPWCFARVAMPRAHERVLLFDDFVKKSSAFVAAPEMVKQVRLLAATSQQLCGPITYG
jgi:hypothetical protein